MSTRTQDFLSNFLAAAASCDADRVVECFASDCRFDLPVHPARGFVGREQARRNWSTIFETVPDLSIELLDAAHHGDTCWAELKYSGTRTDGSPHLMHGVIVVTVDAESRLSKARFYVEFVDSSEGSITEHLEAMQDSAHIAAGRP
ncbi:nuclear transport factor 2 family protein [Streptomyces sp. NPDC056975]|uniref:nuclear transport factor 2 family protein n=1 Tax=Streptomyces sp. NPDC056975 TaxID=3345985 RepID=UPI003627BACD